MSNRDRRDAGARYFKQATQMIDFGRDSVIEQTNTGECRGNKAMANLMQHASLTGDNNNASKDPKLPATHFEYRNALVSLPSGAITTDRKNFKQVFLLVSAAVQTLKRRFRERTGMLSAFSVRPDKSLKALPRLVHANVIWKTV